MEILEEYKPLDTLSGFYLLTDDSKQRFLIWNNGQYKFPIGPLGYVPKSGLCFYDILAKEARHKKVLDLGCGEMGIISLFSIVGGAKEATAVDIDSRCVSWLSHIKKEYSLSQLEIFESDMFQNVQSKYDIIVSNPPIMPMEHMTKETVHDSGGCDGRLYLYEIIKEAYGYLNDGGQLYLSAFSFLGTDVRTGEQESLKEYALKSGYHSFGVAKNVVKPLSENSVTYRQLPYISKIYPNMKNVQINGKPAVEFQILHICK